MNEFPQAFIQAHHRIASQTIASQGGSGGTVSNDATVANPKTVAINGTEYLELLEAAGVESGDFPPIQAVHHHKLWHQVGSQPTPESVEAAIAELQRNDPSFSMAGASWTNNLSWVEGYANVLEPMTSLSAAFHQRFDPLVAADPAVTRSEPYQQALLHLLLLETSCFRYWGQGSWTDYATEIHRRGVACLES